MENNDLFLPNSECIDDDFKKKEREQAESFKRQFKRLFRPRQKGVECSVEGCAGWCVSNDLCAKHSMQRHRRTEKGKAYVREYNKRYKKLSVEKICKCGLRFETARINQVKCSACSSGKKVDTHF